MKAIKKITGMALIGLGSIQCAWADFSWENGITQTMKKGDAIGGVTSTVSLGANALAVGLVIAFVIIAGMVLKHGVDKMKSADGGISDFFTSAVVAGVVMAFGLGMGYVVDQNADKMKNITISSTNKS